MLSTQLINQLQNIYKTEFGMELSEEQARSVGNSLVSYFDCLLKADEEIKNINENEYDKRQNT